MKYLKQATPYTIENEIQLTNTVSEIICKVRKEGDKAIQEFNTKFDGNSSSTFSVCKEDIDVAYSLVSEEDIRDIREAYNNIKEFAQQQRKCMLDLDEVKMQNGAILGHRLIPMSSVLCYIPGGSYPLFSTALMLIVPAKVAGVGRVVACSPVDKLTNKINAKTLVAMDIAGADEIYAIGGAQSIAAFSYGTEQIIPVDFIVGPGNKYVAEAKRQCYGKVGIDFVAGPSEVLIIADESANPRIIAADILAQSEHDKVAKGILVTTSESLAKYTILSVEDQLKELSTSKIAQQAWENNAEIILVDTLEEAAKIANEYAPEHLEIMTTQNDNLKKLVINYGSLFLGMETGEVFGDYASGTNHTLPTQKASRYTGGVWVGTFIKICTHQSFNQDATQKIIPLVSRMARAEGLEGHAKAAEFRTI